ncbi:MAG: hypothetical protein CVV64_12350 [Candidatus Wallbacteria bacterium HGW-Wallbacteria-1]|uniref:DUF3147 domain-containing protein n=1 Tax=Candidatus Wallbacteria bacterium HGW-Wallbacteria-1 TaxID=2013854 RepID=A0A2N1PNB0_9BACT|nr:MAG: hypothetical protein CVV64_12350 [Candidatus Wallbacteria bacterium HGW-Wallbacteria-1]
MLRVIVKLLLTSGIIVAVSEISKRGTLLGAFAASLPLVSLLGMTWLYMDTGNAPLVANLARDTFWMVIPSLSFFIVFPLLINRGVSFWWAMIPSLIIMFGLYLMTMKLMKMS